MSTAAFVPETRDLTGDDAWQVLRRTGRVRLLKDAFRRMRAADGFSHARSLGLMTALVTVQGVIALVGLANLLHTGGVSDIIVAVLRRAVPGPVGQILTVAVSQAHRAATGGGYGPVLIGLFGALFAGTTALGQIERGLNRLYGVEQDRRAVKKYGLAFALAISAGTLSALALGCLAFGRDIVHSRGGTLVSVWSVARWPAGLALAALAVMLLFRWCPRRSQPRLSWLAFGAGVSVLLWSLATAGLGLFYGLSSSFGKTYGPLAGIVALLVWCLLSSTALLFGAAVAAQLEAVRAGRPVPQDAEKVAESEPAGDEALVAARAG